MMDDLTIPDFLDRRSGNWVIVRNPRERSKILSAPRRNPEPWARPKPPRGWPKGMPVPKTVTPEALSLAREIDRREKEKAKARFAALRERRSR